MNDWVKMVSAVYAWNCLCWGMSMGEWCVQFLSLLTILLADSQTVQEGELLAVLVLFCDYLAGALVHVHHKQTLRQSEGRKREIAGERCRKALLFV